MKTLGGLAGELFGLFAVLYPALIIKDEIGLLGASALLILVYVMSHAAAIGRK